MIIAKVIVRGAFEAFVSVMLGAIAYNLFPEMGWISAVGIVIAALTLIISVADAQFMRMMKKTQGGKQR